MLLLYPSIPPGIVEFFYHFTFHYASTISLSPADSPGWERAFTFHYASTISCSSEGLMSLFSPLHSTMLLLYPAYNGKGAYTNNFTFHYASTISYQVYFPLVLRIWLYIPLCFYYIECSYCITADGKALYIPLCFYYILC